ncbi:MAG: metallophosphoesterase family protein [Atopobiaceae bacterium]
MACYALSDIHGRLKTLDRLLEKVGPAEDDELYILGDMIDRGPDSVDVMKLCRSLPNATVLLGNHEQLMLDCFHDMGDQIALLNWAINGGVPTAKGLMKLKAAERHDLLDWVGGLARWIVKTVGGRTYILVHAGVKSEALPPDAKNHIPAALAAQDSDDLIWIREGYLDRPTGLLDEKGEGPIIVGGHTPTALAETLADCADRSALNDDGRCQMLSLGATEETGGVADRLVIDCGAGSVPEHGRLCMLRLDDRKEFYEDVLDGD